MNPIAQNPKDFWTCIIYIAIGGTAVFLSRDYGMGTALKMGPAYFPTMLGCLLILIGGISVARSFVKRGTPIGRLAKKGLLLVIAATLLFGFIVRGAGLAVALPLMIVVSASASTRFDWRRTLALALGVTVFCVLIFQVGLGVPLPIVGPWFGG